MIMLPRCAHVIVLIRGVHGLDQGWDLGTVPAAKQAQSYLARVYDSRMWPVRTAGEHSDAGAASVPMPK